jgi:hypothetical protein
MDSNYKVTGKVAQVFPVKGEGRLTATFNHIATSFKITVSNDMTSSRTSDDHKTNHVTIGVEKLEYESSGLHASDNYEITSNSGMTKANTRDMEAVLFWKLSQTLGSKMSDPVTNCLQKLLWTEKERK